MQAALQAVALIRQQRRDSAALDTSVAWVKQFQTLRFRHCYADMLASTVYGGVARFFLERLYAQAQPQHLDDQFARIAPSIARVFPDRVVETAVEVGQLHLLTETLDQAMGNALTQRQEPSTLPKVSCNEALACYVAVWREVAHTADRNRQLEMALDLGNTMTGLVKIPGLALGLKLMRGPAQLAHLGDLQNWLEEGFVTFAALDRRAGATDAFLKTVEHREAEKLLRASLLQIFYSIRSERMLMEQMQYNLLFRWFAGLAMDDSVWVPTVYSKNRERWQEMQHKQRKVSLQSGKKQRNQPQNDQNLNCLQKSQFASGSGKFFGGSISAAC